MSPARGCALCFTALSPTSLWGFLLATAVPRGTGALMVQVTPWHCCTPGAGPRGNPAAKGVAKGWCGWQGSPCARGAQGQAWGSYSPWPDSAKPHIAWSVCRGRPSSPRGYHTFLSCLQNAVTTNCKNQPHPHLIRVKPAQLCTTSPACPVLCVLLQATAIAQACFHLLLSGCFSTADCMAHEDGW